MTTQHLRVGVVSDSVSLVVALSLQGHGFQVTQLAENADESGVDVVVVDVPAGAAVEEYVGGRAEAAGLVVLTTGAVELDGVCVVQRPYGMAQLVEAVHIAARGRAQTPNVEGDTEAPPVVIDLPETADQPEAPAVPQAPPRVRRSSVPALFTSRATPTVEPTSPSEPDPTAEVLEASSAVPSPPPVAAAPAGDTAAAAATAVTEPNRPVRPRRAAPKAAARPERPAVRARPSVASAPPPPEAAAIDPVGTVLESARGLRQLLVDAPFLKTRHRFAAAIAATLADDLDASAVVLWSRANGVLEVLGSIGLTDAERHMTPDARHPLFVQATDSDGLTIENSDGPDARLLGIPGTRTDIVVVRMVDDPELPIEAVVVGGKALAPDVFGRVASLLDESRSGWAAVRAVEELWQEMSH